MSVDKSFTKENLDVLVEFEEDYPEVLNGDILAEILKAAKAKNKIQERLGVLAAGCASASPTR